MKRYGDYEKLDNVSLTDEKTMNDFFNRVVKMMKDTECDSSSIEMRIHKIDDGQFIYCKWTGKEI